MNDANASEQRADYYVRVIRENDWTCHRELWIFTETGARHAGDVTRAFEIRPQPGETIWDAFRRTTPFLNDDGSGTPFYKLALPPGSYFPRIARPWSIAESTELVYPRSLDEHALITTARTQLTVLVRLLDRICQTVHPGGKSLDAYGHDIRNLLLLACMEVEAQLVGIAKANGLVKSANQATMRDYILLNPALRLSDYRIGLQHFPSCADMRPFSAWAGASTQGLPWYQAYNATKHDREVHFECATLRFAIEAVCAVAILLHAQFGELGFPSSEPGATFAMIVPSWEIADCYTSYGSGTRWEEVATAWNPVNFPFAPKKTVARKSGSVRRRRSRPAA